MKKISLLKMFIVVTSLTTVNMSAQLTGQYTINKNAPVSASNFTSFTAFATAINGLGVSGSVSVNVVANTGPYVEQVQFASITGASATNTIAINGNGNLLNYTMATSSMPWVLNLNGTDYFHLSNLNLKGTGFYALLLIMNGNADYNSFTNCEFENPLSPPSFSNIAIVISGSNQSALTASNSANSNTFTSCTTKYGHRSVVMGGNQGFGNNSFISCKFLDAANRGIHSFQQTGLVVKDCVIDRANRAPLSGYANFTGIYLEKSAAAIIEGNWIKNINETASSSNLSVNGIQMLNNGGTGVGTENVIRNNIISDINVPRTVMAVRLNEANVKCYHNSIILNNLKSVGPFSPHKAFETAAMSSILEIKNNLVHAILSSSAATNVYGIHHLNGPNLTSSNNLFYYFSMNGTPFTFVKNGTPYVGLTAYQAAGNEVGSTDLDPYLISANHIPSSYSVNDMGTPLSSVPFDYNGTVRSTTAPDYGAFEFLNVPCVGVPVGNTIIGPATTLCAYQSAVNLSLASPSVYSIYTGLNFQWQTSATSSVGPFTAISGATNVAITTATAAQTKWYNAVITCTNGGNFSTSAVATEVEIASVTTNTPPYFEGFENISGPNVLPNCSWWAPNIGNGRVITSKTAFSPNGFPHTGAGYAAFSDINAGDDYFYTNGIYLNAGVTYSASLWYITAPYIYNITESDLSIKVGMNQDTTGHVTIASTNGTPFAIGYKSLSNTFSVATSGLYYVAVKGSNTGGSWGTRHVTWDDLAIEIPCSLNPNPVSINAAPGVMVCEDQTVTLTASGTGNFQWSNGATTPTITVQSNGNVTYVVTLTNSLTGCSSSASKEIEVNPNPVVGVFVPVAEICKGSSVNINAFGALYYSWSGGGSTPVINVTPTVSTTYTVTGKNQYGCEGFAVQTINVKDLPLVSAVASKDQICVGEMVTLTASGAVSYKWISQNNFVVGSPVVVNPQTTTTYSLTGTDVNGCKGSSSFVVSVSPCTGVGEISSTEGNIKVYPNPNDGTFVIEFNNDNKRIIEITDVTGRLVKTELASDKKAEVNIGNLAGGVYYVKVKSDKASEVIRIIKN